MIPEIGQIALIIAFVIAILQSILPLLALHQNNQQWQAIVKPCAYGLTFFVTLAYAVLTYSFISNDFTVRYVALNSNTALPLFYRVSALWGGHEGSMLLWLFIYTIWMVLFTYRSRDLPRQMVNTILAIMAIIATGLLAFILFTSNPFLRFLPQYPTQGIDLNPVLQDPGLIIHPPILYFGYVGFSIPFAFAVAALLLKYFDKQWAQWLRPWTIAAWGFLTAGITLGSWWSYRVLGWGGWWAWDPVENASFLPWLVGTALIHCLLAMAKRGICKGWAILLAISTFGLSLIGTFLVRSGLLPSVHAFANDPQRGLFLLIFLTIIIAGSLLLYAYRAHTIVKQGQFSFLSRESFLLVNNLLLLIIAATILLGTIYPMMLDILKIAKISIGPSYFNALFIPLFCFLLVFMGIAPLLRWHHDKNCRRYFLLVFALLMIVFTICHLIMQLAITFVMALSLAAWLCLSLFLVMYRAWRGGNIKNYCCQYGAMIIAHFAVAICTLAIAFVSHDSVRRDVKMQVGDLVSVGPYKFKFTHVKNISGPNYQGVQADFDIYSAYNWLARVNAYKLYYPVRNVATSKPGIHIGVLRDSYVALGQSTTENIWSVRLYVNTGIRWLWFGGFLMVFAAIWAIRYYNGHKGKEQIVAEAKAVCH